MKIKNNLKLIAVAVNLGLFVVSVASALVFLEVLLRVLRYPLYLPTQHNSLFEYNADLGWQFVPNKSANIVAHGEHQGVVKINSFGMRDKERSVEKPKEAKRIVVLGDSFASNLDVDLRHVFTGVMETMLPGNWQVLNFGVNGFGSLQELLLLKNSVVHFDPDIVMMVIYIRNDLEDLSGKIDFAKGYWRPKARLDDKGRLLIDSALMAPLSAQDASRNNKDKKQPLFMAILERSYLYDYVRYSLLDKNHIRKMPPEVMLFNKQISPETEALYSIQRAVLKEADRFSRENNAEFVVVIAPTLVQVYESRFWNEIKKMYNLNDKDYDINLPNKIIQQISRDLGIRCIDLTQGFKVRARKGERLYYFRNQHWNNQGNNLAAKIISQYLLESNLVR